MSWKFDIFTKRTNLVKDSFLPQFVYSIKAAFGCVLFLIFGLMELLAPHCNIIINKLAILCSEKVLKLMNEKIRRTNQVWNLKGLAIPIQLCWDIVFSILSRLLCCSFKAILPALNDGNSPKSLRYCSHIIEDNAYCSQSFNWFNRNIYSTRQKVKDKISRVAYFVNFCLDPWLMGNFTLVVYSELMIITINDYNYGSYHRNSTLGDTNIQKFFRDLDHNFCCICLHVKVTISRS